ncbi:hypothetical protein KR222_000345, partial [Zaprionus bogoriensis]
SCAMQSVEICRVFRPQLLIQLLVFGLVVAGNWKDEIEVELQRQTDKLAYCRTLQRLQQEYDETLCAQILQDELTMTGELLMDTQRRCWWGWELFGQRCRKRA